MRFYTLDREYFSPLPGFSHPGYYHQFHIEDIEHAYVYSFIPIYRRPAVYTKPPALPKNTYFLIAERNLQAKKTSEIFLSINILSDLSR